jgi:putative membrane protein insertion efficiency factor
MLKRVVLKLIRFYQSCLAWDGWFFRFFFLTDKACRFEPTCSEYTYQAIEKYGILGGSWIGLKRIIRCHPWSKGGNDPVK